MSSAIRVSCQLYTHGRQHCRHGAFPQQDFAAAGGKILPIVKKTTARVNLAQKYDQFAGKAAKFGLVDEKQANLENYVTQKALEGLFLMMAEEEKAIRADPVGQTSKVLSKVFGAIGKQVWNIMAS